VGDMVSMDRSPCPHCGRHGDRIIGPIVRTKDLVKVKGMLINPAVLLDTLQSLPEVDELQVVVQRMDAQDEFSMDELLVRLATNSTDREQLAGLIADRVQAAVRVRPRVEFAAALDIYDPSSQTKALRFVDKR